MLALLPLAHPCRLRALPAADGGVTLRDAAERETPVPLSALSALVLCGLGGAQPRCR